MRTMRNFKRTHGIVRESIHRIDPFSLLEGGSPDDEFDSEIMSIVGQLHRCGSGRDISHAIARVLTSSFGEKFDASLFEAEGRWIYDTLIKHGLV